MIEKAATCPRECSEHHTFEPPCLLATKSALPEFAHVVLAPDEYLLLTPKDGQPLSQEHVEAISTAIPDGLRGRVLVFDDSLDAKVVRCASR